MAANKSRRATNIVWTFIALLAFAAGALWFLSNFELVEKSYRTSPEKEARINPYLAAERFLIKNNIAVNSSGGVKRLDELPPVTDTIFLANFKDKGLLSKERSDALYDWMKRGGHLVTVIHTLWNDKLNTSGNPFLDRFGIRKYKHDYSFEDIKEIPPVETEFAGKGGTLTLDFRPQFYMLDDKQSAYAGIAAAEGYYLLQYGVAGGTLTVLTDDQLWRNNKISEYDHALFFYNLVVDGAIDSELSPTVWILHNLEFASLPTLIWRNAPYAVIVSALLLIFALWAAYNRFGPPLVDNYRIRRSLVEHLDASGRYHWHRDKGNYLLNTLRKQLTQSLEKHHSNWRRLDREQQIDWLSERSRQMPDELIKALDRQPQNEHEFTEIVHTLQRLRKTI